MVGDNCVQGGDIYGENVLVFAWKIEFANGFEGMIGFFDIYDGSDLMKGDTIWSIYLLYQLCWAAVDGDSVSAWVIKFMNFGFKIND